MEIHISRSEQKRRIKQLEKLVENMARLPVSLLDALPCSRDIINLVRDTTFTQTDFRIYSAEDNREVTEIYNV